MSCSKSQFRQDCESGVGAGFLEKQIASFTLEFSAVSYIPLGDLRPFKHRKKTTRASHVFVLDQQTKGSVFV
jgi:hypothetical protein